MKHVEMHAYYLRQLVQEKVVSLVYCRIDDKIAYLFRKPLTEFQYVKIWALLRIQEDTIIGGCTERILPLESPRSCADEGGCKNNRFIPSMDPFDIVSVIPSTVEGLLGN
nr:hypothetical protein Q903MT_gene1374 [Picea sitchensis]